ncbi:unnamed protein product [Urochloa humidicola]
MESKIHRAAFSSPRVVPQRHQQRQIRDLSYRHDLHCIVVMHPAGWPPAAAAVWNNVSLGWCSRFWQGHGAHKVLDSINKQRDLKKEGIDWISVPNAELEGFADSEQLTCGSLEDGGSCDLQAQAAPRKAGSAAALTRQEASSQLGSAAALMRKARGKIGSISFSVPPASNILTIS